MKHKYRIWCKEVLLSKVHQSLMLPTSFDSNRSGVKLGYWVFDIDTNPEDILALALTFKTAVISLGTENKKLSVATPLEQSSADVILVCFGVRNE